MSGVEIKSEGESLVVQWGERSLDIIDKNGERWVTVKQLSKMLGYDRPDNLVRLMDRNADEFKGKTLTVKLTENVGRPETVVNAHGMIRVAMLAKTKQAKKFRDEAEDILFKVMVEGHALISKEGQHKIKSEVVTMDVLDSRMEQIAATITSAVIKALPAAIPQQTPAEMYQQAINVSRNNYMTPTECAYELFGGLPAGFNSGGHFDDYCAMRHMEEFGRYPERREPPLFKGNKIREWILPKDVKHKQYVKMWGKEYLKKHTSGQTSLKFKPTKPTVNKRRLTKKDRSRRASVR